MAKLEERGVALNVAFLVGHGTLRTAVMGPEQRLPSPDELPAMQELLRRELKQGALGLSTGLIYAPSMYADIDEVVALAQVLREYGRLYTSYSAARATPWPRRSQRRSRSAGGPGCWYRFPT